MGGRSSRSGGASNLEPSQSSRRSGGSGGLTRGAEGRLRAARYACRLFRSLRSPRSLARARARRRILSARNPRPPAPAGALNWRARYLARPQADCRGRERSPQASISPLPPKSAPDFNLPLRWGVRGMPGGVGGRRGEGGRAPQRACAPQRTSSARPRGGALPLSHLLRDTPILRTCPLPYLQRGACYIARIWIRSVHSIL